LKYRWDEKGRRERWREEGGEKIMVHNITEEGRGAGGIYTHRQE
jgi:hypothetical protein